MISFKKTYFLIDHHQVNFDALIHRAFGIIPELTAGCKLFHDVIYPFSPISNYNVGQEEGKVQKFQYHKDLNSASDK